MNISWSGPVHRGWFEAIGHVVVGMLEFLKYYCTFSPCVWIIWSLNAGNVLLGGSSIFPGSHFWHRVKEWSLETSIIPLSNFFNWNQFYTSKWQQNAKGCSCPVIVCHARHTVTMNSTVTHINKGNALFARESKGNAHRMQGERSDEA